MFERNQDFDFAFINSLNCATKKFRYSAWSVEKKSNFMGRMLGLVG